MNKKGFTLVEIVVVIVIISILTTIAYIGVQQWIDKSNNTARTADIDSISIAIEGSILSSGTGKFPLPDSNTGITNTSGVVLWYQGTFGKGAIANVMKLNKEPKDPVTQEFYKYSVSSDQSKYQVFTFIEGEQSAGNLTSKAYAQDSSHVIKGNYNGYILAKLGTSCTISNIDSMYIDGTTQIAGSTEYTIYSNGQSTNYSYTPKIVNVSELCNGIKGDEQAAYTKIINIFSGGVTYPITDATLAKSISCDYNMEGCDGQNTVSNISSSSSSSGPIGYYVNNGNIYKQDGTLINLKGINWNGFELSSKFIVSGLNASGYNQIISHMKTLGFNAVRIPYCPDALKPTTSIAYTNQRRPIDYSKNPDLTGLNSLQAFDKIITALNNAQMYILLDFHRIDCTSSDTTESFPFNGTFTKTDWINNLKYVADRYKNLDYFIGIDLKNEPHGDAMWGTGGDSRDRKVMAEDAGQGVLQSNPKLLVFVEGVEHNNFDYRNPICESTAGGHFWGGNIEPIECYPINSSKIPANKLVLSPHIYGPDVYGGMKYYTGSNRTGDSAPGKSKITLVGTNFTQANMNIVWNWQIGRFAPTYTIVPGEIGGCYGVGAGGTKDIDYQNWYVAFLKSKNIKNAFFRSRSAESLDANNNKCIGLFHNDNWTTVITNKLNNFMSLFSG